MKAYALERWQHSALKPLKNKTAKLPELVKEINRLLEEKEARLKGMHKVNEHSKAS